ncbi:MAG TPA: ScpA family protein [Candidatus Paceibacterota bacterium]|nr:ScpA family protein [Candidatus Paceibacterota bacterium]
MEYETRVGEFSGPLEKLLELIEAEKMDVSEVSLAKVTDDFLKYLETFKSGLSGDAAAEAEVKFRGDLRVLADFVSVASKLIFLKSKYLLPGLALTEEEEADIKDLEARLHIYQQLKPAIKLINRLWQTSHHSFSRPYFLGRGTGNIPGQTMFYPGANLDTEALAAALGSIFDSIKTYDLETETIREKIVTLEEKISEVLGRIQKEGDMRFGNLSGEKSRGEMIVVFLAILHLAREQLVLLEQMDNFSDIMVKKK